MAFVGNKTEVQLDNMAGQLSTDRKRSEGDGVVVFIDAVKDKKMMRKFDVS